MATYTGSCGKYTIILNVSEVSSSIDVSSNTSKVSWSLQFRADTAYCQWNPGPGDFEVKINGASVWSAQNPSLWFGGSGQTLTLASGTSGAITHNSDGAKTVSCQAIYTQNSTANYLPSSGSCSGNLMLSTIPRASSFSSIIGNVIGESQTINIDRKSSNFTNNLWYRVGDEDWVSIGTGIETSKTWTLPTSLNNKIPNATSLTLTYLLRTYNGSTQIGGDVTYSFNVNYSGEKPTAGTATITYSKLFNNKFIANYSSGTINYSGYDGVYGSTVKSAQVVFNGSWKGVTSYNTGLLTAGTHTFQGVVTDSRENTSYTTQQSFTCYQINNPTVSINAYRSDSSGNANPSGTYITIIPTYSAHDPVGGNSIKSSSFTCTSLMTTGTAITSGSKKILSGAATDSQYVISGTVTDQLGRTSATSVQIGTAFALWDVRPDQRGMAFGKYSTGPDKFEVAWDAYFDNDMNVTGHADIGSEKVNGSLEVSGVSTLNNDLVVNRVLEKATVISSNADLNTVTYLKIGQYYCSNNANAGTLINSPTNYAFKMFVNNPSGDGYDNESQAWICRVRILIDVVGEIWIQKITSESTAGSFIYGSWHRILDNKNYKSLIHNDLLVKEVELASTATTVTIDGLDLLSDKQYEFEVIGGQSAYSDWWVRFNGDSSAKYYTAGRYDSGDNHSANAELSKNSGYRPASPGFYYALGLGPVGIVRGKITYVKSNKTAVMEWETRDVGYAKQLITSAIGLYDKDISLTNLTSVTFAIKTSGVTFSTGTIFRIKKVL